MDASERTYSRYAGANQATVRKNNRAAIYQAVWEQGPISRSELAAQTGLHAATITHIVEDLEHEGLVKETGIGESTVGRPRIQLEIEPDAAYALGVHLGRDGIRAVLTDLRGCPVEQVSLVGLRGHTEGETAMKRLVNTTRLLLETAAGAGRRVAGIGVGIPGPVEPLTGLVRRSPNWSIWDGEQPLPLGKFLGEQFGLPVFVDNNANATALAERYFGIGRSVHNFLHISCGFGVGSGLIVDGNLHHGFLGGAGEVGHMIVHMDGPACTCGNAGCLELYASMPAILKRAAAVLGTDPDDLTLAQVAEAYRRGNPEIAAALDEVATPLATAVINLVLMVAPEAVVLGGLLGELAPVLAERVEAKVRGRVFTMPPERNLVVASSLPGTPALGPATLVLEAIVNSGKVVLE